MSLDKGYICKQPCSDIKQWRKGKLSRKLWVLVTLCRVSSYKIRGGVFFFFFFRLGEDGEENESADREEQRKRSRLANKKLDIISLPGEVQPFADKLRPLV